MRLIDADELIRHFEEIANDSTLPFEAQAYALGAINDVKKQPTVERPAGEWTFDEEHSITMNLYKCTNCNYFGGNNSYRYCPRCGAKMEEKNDT